MSEEMRDFTNGVTVALFAVFLLLSVFRMTARLLRHHRLGYRPPLLLYRDLILLGVLTLLILAPAIFHVITGVVLAEELWWVVLRSILGVSAMAFWWFIEWARIGRNGDTE